MNCKRLVVAMAVGLAAVATSHAYAQSNHSAVVVFGTSLSDPGNAFALAGGTNTPTDFSVDPFLVPSQPYAIGGHHFSNGPTWIEQLAQALGVPGSAEPAFRSSSATATNFAVGGARARPGTNTVDLTTQVGAFLQRTGGRVSPEALYVIEMGGNDVRDALGLAAQGGDPFAVLNQAAASVAASVAALHNAGGKRFLVWTSPDIGLTPAVRRLGATAALVAMQLTVYYNTVLANAFVPMASFPDLEVRWLDAFTLMHAIVQAPPLFGLTNATDPCLTPSSAPYFCQAPGTFLFWDGIHPTRAGHAVLAGQARALVAP